jgi:hypothetical protein
VETAFAETDGGVEGGEAAEADVECGDRGARAEFAIFLLEDDDEGRGRGGFFSAGFFGFGIGSGRLECCCGDIVKERGGWCGRRGKKLQELTQR